MHRILKSVDNEDNYCRKSSPKDTRKLWKCLESIGFRKSRRQFIKTLFNANINEFESESHLKTIINNALKDKLVAEEVDKNNGYRLRIWAERQVSQKSDFYCFECHSCNDSEELIGCVSCFRSFHESCLKSDDESGICCDQQMATTSSEQSLNTGNAIDSNHNLNTESNQNCVQNLDIESTEKSIDLIEEQEKSGSHSPTIYTSLSASFGDDFKCRYCYRITCPDITSELEIMCGEDLWQLIDVFYRTIENQMKNKNIDIYSHYSIESTLNTYSLIFSSMDLKTIKLKVFDFRNYLSFGEFVNDLRHFCHNFCIIGDENCIKPFIDVIDEELHTLKSCLHCYLWSKSLMDERLPPEEWLLHVCDPPHPLVYAKYSSYPYWPSRILEENSNGCKVWFFEPVANNGVFTYAYVPKEKIKPIDYKLKLNKLKSPQIIESVALLLRYLKNLRKQSSPFQYESVIERLEGVLTTQWRKHKYSFLSDFNFEVKPIVKKIKKSKKCEGCEALASHQFINTKRFRPESPPVSPQLSITSGDSLFSLSSIESFEVFTDGPTLFDPFLGNTDDEVEEEERLKFCGIYHSFITETEFVSKESEESQESQE